MGKLQRIQSVILTFIVFLLPQAYLGQQLAGGSTPGAPVSLTLPNREGSVRLLVFGDAGRGSKEQYELGALMERFRQSFAYDTVLMTGDNIYYEDTPADMKKKFEEPYKALLDNGVKFYASLGNHDSPNQRLYALFNMNGEEYYRIEKGGVAIYALNSVYMDKRQLDWFNAQLAKDTAAWRIAFFHHPPFSSGKRHGSDDDLRKVLHPVLLNGGIDVVFTGHDHFYERVKPQGGLQYFVAGAAGKVRKGDIQKNSGLTEKGYDADLSFMLVEIIGDEMYFQVIARNGTTVDSGSIRRRD